jgi:putative membrane protein
VALGISLVVRGPGRSLRLLAASLVTAAAGEVLGVRVVRAIRHHSRPQVAGVPLLIPLGWYAFLAPAYGLAQAAAGHRGPRAVAAATAFLATATDLAADPWGLASGYWEWRDGGAYLRDVVGPNGAGGVPLANFAGWLAVAGAVALLCEPGRPPAEGTAARRHRTLLLAGYAPLGIGGLWWALRTGRLRLLAVAGAAVYGGAAWAWLAAGRPPV